MLGVFREPMQLSRCVLSLRPRSGEQVPLLTAQASNPGGTAAMWVRDRLDALWRDEDFADWYPRDGRPGLSPAQLATVCVLQFVLGLSNRQAAEVVRCRIDFKYVMAMELDDPGFHHSVLADFRDRLTEGNRAHRLLDLAPARLKEAGLVRERSRTIPASGTSSSRSAPAGATSKRAGGASSAKPPWPDAPSATATTSPTPPRWPQPSSTPAPDPGSGADPPPTRRIRRCCVLPLRNAAH
ncbi:transposase [Streptomyces sp. NPDC046931]|uniref:transposase n=1 Tax=Streptomyces sp. NPDC046931 TaxID=3154806 RepID=UPI0033EDE6C2